MIMKQTSVESHVAYSFRYPLVEGGESITMITNFCHLSLYNGQHKSRHTKIKRGLYFVVTI